MKKIILFTLMMLGVAFAEDEHWGYSCTNSEVLRIAPQNLEIIAKTAMAVVTVDGKSVKANKKNGTAAIWLTYIGNPEMRNYYVSRHGSEFQNLGYVKQLKLYNFKTGKSKILTTTYYACDGRSIETVGEQDWDYIVQGSVDEEAYNFSKKSL